MSLCRFQSKTLFYKSTGKRDLELARKSFGSILAPEGSRFLKPGVGEQEETKSSRKK
jgi:hypothetical protein